LSEPVQPGWRGLSITISKALPYVVPMVIVVVGVDILFFRHQFWLRLMANVGILLTFAAL
jgi:hypothetical protein